MRALLVVQADLIGDTDQPIEVVIAGGVAVHYWTGDRATGGAYCEFLNRVLVSEEHVFYEDEEGKTQALYFDRNFSASLGPMHDAYLDRRVRVTEWEPSPSIRAYVLDPVDLAISKLGRFETHDRADICSLAEHGLIDCEEFERLATEAIGYYVGNKGFLPQNLADAVTTIKRCTPAQSGEQADESDEPAFDGPR